MKVNTVPLELGTFSTIEGSLIASIAMIVTKHRSRVTFTIDELAAMLKGGNELVQEMDGRHVTFLVRPLPPKGPLLMDVNRPEGTPSAGG